MIHTNQEKASALSRPILRNKDICILLDCGSKRACEISREFREWFIEQKGYEPYNKQIPTEIFIEYAGINEKRILRYAKMGY